MLQDFKKFLMRGNLVELATINHSQFNYGDFLNALVTFVMTAAVVFFLVVRPYNTLMARRAEEEPDTKECPAAIPIRVRRCPQCTAPAPA